MDPTTARTLAVYHRNIAKALDNMANNPVSRTYTTKQVSEFANRGQILLMRNGAVVADYGDTRVTDANYATGLAECFAAANQAGDVIFARGFRAATSGTGLTLAQSAVRLLCDDVLIYPSGNYSALLTVSGEACQVEGVTADGRRVANTTAAAKGIYVTGAKCLLRNVACNNVLGPVTAGTDGLNFWWGNGLHIQAPDVTVDGLYVESNGYAGIILDSANRATVKNVKAINPLQRFLNAQGSGVDWISIESVEGVFDDTSLMYPGTAGTTVGLGMNWNTSASIIGTLHLKNIKMINGDVISAGNSYNNASTMHMSKLESINTLYMDGVEFYHGDNAGSGVATSFRLEEFEGPVPKEIYITNSRFADGFTFGDTYPEFMRVTNTAFGSRQNSATVLIWDVRCKDILFDSCIFNGHGGSRTFTISGSHAATDRFGVKNSRFLANRATDFFVCNSEIARSVGNNLFHGNTLENAGAGEFYLCNGADNETGELSLNMDANGDLLFDDSRIGTGPGQHPAPGTAVPHFALLGPPAERQVLDGVTAGTTTITSATAAFVAGDVNKLIWVYGGTGPVAGVVKTISSVTNSTTIVVNDATGLAAGTGVTLRIGPKNGRRIFNINWAPGDELTPTFRLPAYIARDGQWVEAP